MPEKEKMEHPLTNSLLRLMTLQRERNIQLLWITPQIKKEIDELFEEIPRNGKIIFDLVFDIPKQFNVDYNLYESIKNICGSKSLLGLNVILVSDDEELKKRLKEDQQTFTTITTNELQSIVSLLINEFKLDTEMRI